MKNTKLQADFLAMLDRCEGIIYGVCLHFTDHSRDSVDDLYHGVTPELVPDFYGLKGDSSDNIPGVPGIGPKKAAALIVEYGSLDEVIAHADEVKGKMGENLRAHIDDALVSRKVATIRTDAPVELDLADAKFPTFEAQTVTDAFSALGFTGMISRLLRLGGAETSVDVAPAPTLEVPEPLSGDAARAALDAAIADGAPVAAELQSPETKKGQQSLFAEEERCCASRATTPCARPSATSRSRAGSSAPT